MNMKFIRKNIVCIILSLCLIITIVRIIQLNDRVDLLLNQVRAQQELLDLRRTDFFDDRFLH